MLLYGCRFCAVLFCSVGTSGGSGKIGVRRMIIMLDGCYERTVPGCASCVEGDLGNEQLGHIGAGEHEDDIVGCV